MECLLDECFNYQIYRATVIRQKDQLLDGLSVEIYKEVIKELGCEEFY